MRKTVVALFLVMASVTFAFAAGKSEKLAEIEGTAVFAADENGQTMLMVQRQDGSLVRVMIPEAELQRLQIRETERIRVEGVFIGSTAEMQIQERVAARTMTANNATVTVKDPVTLTEQDREQIRLCEAEQSVLQSKVQTREGTQTGTSGSGSESKGSGNGGAASSGKK